MTDQKGSRLSKLAKEFNVGISTIVEFLHKKGHDIENNPNAKVGSDIVAILEKEYSKDLSVKKESEKLNLKNLREKKESISLQDIEKPEETDEDSEDEPDSISEIIGLKKHTTLPQQPVHPKKVEEPLQKEPEIKIVGKVDLESLNTKRDKPKEKSEHEVKPPQKQIVEEKPEPVVPVVPVAPKVETPKEIIEEQPKEQLTVVAPKEEVKPAPVAKTAPVKDEEMFDDEQKNTDEDNGNDQEGMSEEISGSGIDLKVVGKIDLEAMNQRTRPPKKTRKEREQERRQKEQQNRSAQNSANQNNTRTAGTSQSTDKDDNVIRAKADRLSGPTVVGKIQLPDERKKPVASSNDANKDRNDKKKRKRIKVDNKVAGSNQPGQQNHQQGGGGNANNDNRNRGGGHPQQGGGNNANRTNDNRNRPQGGNQNQGNNANKRNVKRPIRQEVNEEDVQKQIKETLARLTANKGKSKTSKYRREKRDMVSQRSMEEAEQMELEKHILKVTEFVSVNELATMMDVPATKVIGSCMSLGLFVSINQRLDAETMSIVADEFGYKLEFISAELQDAINEEEDHQDDMLPRPPIVTVMGHVDHGKTKLLDFVRNTNVIAGEAGGITQHIGAYSVRLKSGKMITFLDTPGHEAFTAMRARGAQATDIAIIVVAADDGVMPQTVEAINHAQAASIPIIFAINKIDKPSANPEKIKEELANMNLLVEDWGGKYQSQEISAKSGLNVEVLLEKVLLEAEMLDLRANPNKRAKGTVIESSLDKGRGYVATILIDSGTLHVGDMVLAGAHYGHIKAMFNERGKRIDIAGPSTPALILGLNGAPQAGDKFNGMTDEKEAKEIATKREQLQREQNLRTRKHITLDEIGRRIAIGNFQELNVVVKGDVDGSVEALSDSLIKLSTEEVQVNIIHKAVGQITESDVLLAAASNAIVLGFQVRPSLNARRLAEKEQIDIRLYSIIYDAIEQVKDAMEGMLSPEVKEEIVATVEVRETFKITKVGTVAGCMVKEGKVSRNNKIRIIRDGIVIYTGNLGSLKRFKEDVKDVTTGFECGLNIEGFNDIQAGDIIEAFIEIEIKKKL
jgi:translation initiation factor IF-2